MSANKPQPLIGIVLTALSALLVVGLRTFAASCEVTVRAVFGVGIVLLVLSLVRIFEQDEGERRGLSFAAGLLGALVAYLPGALVDLCTNHSAQGHAITQPFCIAVGVAIAVVGLGDLIFRLAKLFR